MPQKVAMEELLKYLGIYYGYGKYNGKAVFHCNYSIDLVNNYFIRSIAGDEETTQSNFRLLAELYYYKLVGKYKVIVLPRFILIGDEKNTLRIGT